MMLVLAAVFLATLAIVVVGYVVVNRQTPATAEIARTRLRPEEQAQVRSLLKEERSSDVPFIERLMAGKNWSDVVRTQLLRAGSDLKPGTFLLISAVTGLVVTAVASQLSMFFVALPISLFGWSMPYFWLKWRQKRHLAKFGEQLPDAIEMLVAAMKAGYSFQAATQFIGEEMIDPLGAEFSRFYDEQRLGIDVRSALLNLQNRVDSLDLKMFVTAVIIQRETGGNLSEVLSNLSELIRQRMAIKGHIDTLTAEPKMSAKFLAAIPVIVFLIISAINPDFVQPMLASETGRYAMAAAVVSVITGYIIMMRIADVDI